ncbi:DCC1-like thiol-disulfide oxidoreductase family protein [Brevundimonas sp.]|nr:DCC1-like thiol-disulfide oxidoreductase family protein [Brevundimonas sp.]
MREVVVWYDGACPLCRREIGVMRRLDRRGALLQRRLPVVCG